MTQEWLATMIGGPLGVLIITTLMKLLCRWAGEDVRDLVAVFFALMAAVACGLLLGLFPETPVGLYERVLIGLGGATFIYKVAHEIAKRRAGS